MKRLLLVLLGVALLPGLVAAQATGVVGSKHDLSSTGPGAKTGTTQVCVFCHAPHRDDTVTQAPLWNHTLATTSSYGTYTSNTLNASDVVAVTGIDGSATSLCMSCHDGTVAVNSLYNNPVGGLGSLTAGGNVNGSGFITGDPLLGTSLSNDHPVNFTYQLSIDNGDDGLVTPASTSFVDAGGEVPLFAGKVQCASCHDPHDRTNLPFLVAPIAQSALCTKCHTK